MYSTNVDFEIGLFGEFLDAVLVRAWYRLPIFNGFARVVYLKVRVEFPS